MDQGDADGALRLFENAMTRAEWDRLPPPRRLEALIALAKHAERKRDFAKALRMAEEARFLSPKAEHERRYARLVRKMNQGKLLPE
jgi:acyl-CoA reductase-like NAD-dependent aldehyde dehydrogenase